MRQPSLTCKRLRRLELTAGARRYASEAAGIWHANAAMRKAERELAAQAEAAYRRTVSDWQATQAKRKGAGATPGAHLVGRQAAKQRGGSKPPGPLFSSSSGPAPDQNSRK